MRWYRATTFLERLGGLLARPPLEAGEGLLIAPCRSIHTFGMRYSIDVVFVDGAGCVIAILPRLAPGRIAFRMAARCVVELRAGEAERLGWRLGSRPALPAS